MDSPAFLERQGKPSHVLAAGFAITASLGVIDLLTGAVNSRFFHDLATMEIDRSRRYERPFTVVFIDLDNFKTVNDPFGHSAGDRVLRAMVSSARKHLRKTDVLARLGGDEFGLLLYETDEESARIAARMADELMYSVKRDGKNAIKHSVYAG